MNLPSGPLQWGHSSTQIDRTNLVVWSEATYTCVFDPVSGADESYTGKINKIGLDLTVDKWEKMTWLVLSPSDDFDPGALQGTYVGASADASVGSGAGVRLLVGGGARSFSLQPLSVSEESGVGASAGIEELDLNYSGG